MHQWLLKKISVLNYNGNTDGEKLIMDAHEISVQSAVMSGLEDVNSSQFLLSQIWTISVDTAWNYIRNTSAKSMNIQNLDWTFTKNVVFKELLNK